MREDILIGLILIIMGIYLIYDTLTYKFSRPFRDHNFSGWMWGILCIVGGLYTLVKMFIEWLHRHF